MNEELILGSEAKILVTIEPVAGHSPYDFNFEVEVYTNPKKKVIVPKGECKPTETINAFYVMIDTAEIGVGDITVEVVAHIPDEYFADGLRTEMARIESVATIIP